MSELDDMTGIVCVGREKCLTVEETHKVVEYMRYLNKFMEMWGEFYKKYGLRFFKEHFYEDFSQDKFYGTNTPIKDLMKNLEQKYFPKEASQDYKEGEE